MIGSGSINRVIVLVALMVAFTAIVYGWASSWSPKGAPEVALTVQAVVSNSGVGPTAAPQETASSGVQAIVTTPAPPTSDVGRERGTPVGTRPSAATPAMPTRSPAASPTPLIDTPGDLTAVEAPVPKPESAHPYFNDFDDMWVINGPDGESGATRLRFDRIDLEDSVDWLVVLDFEDNEMQRFTGTYPEGAWTAPVPGSIVKLRLITDGSVRRWGFAVGAVAGASYTSLAYSPHPYPPSYAREWRFNNDDARVLGTRIHFSRVDIEENVDWLVIMDITKQSYQWITGHHPDGLWSLGVPGSGVVVKLVTDKSVGDWGFNIDALSSAEPEAGQPRPEVTTSLAESAHPQGEAGEWTLVNPNTSARFTKVHFTRLDLGYYGNVTITDGDGNLVQQFGNVFVGDIWSDDVPGRVVTIKSGGSNGAWGFRVDRIADGIASPMLAESPHPIEKAGEWTVVNPNPDAGFTKLHFVSLAMGYYGSLVLADGAGNEVQRFSNMSKNDFWSDDVPGRVVTIKSGGSNGAWGFRVDALADGAADEGAVP